MFIEIFKVSLGQIKSDLGEVRNNIWRSEVKLTVSSFFVLSKIFFIGSLT